MTGIFFWRDKNGDFYEAPALQGQQGIQGPPGTPGSMIYNGTALIGDSTVPTTYPNSGVATANVNDYYLNTMNCNLYLCVTGGNPDRAKWKYLCSLRGDYINDAEVTKDSGDLILQSNQGVRLLAGNVVGPAGAAGADGAVGPAGPQGPPGDDYILTEEDKAEIADVAADLVAKVSDTQPTDGSPLWVDTATEDNSGYGYETWTFTLMDGTVVEKDVVLA